MNRKTVLTLFFLALTLLTLPALAQVEEKWEKELPVSLLWQRVTALGQLVVSTQAGLSGIDSETGDVKWRLEGLANLTQEEFVELPDSPFFKVESASGFYLIDQFSGDIVFDSKQAGVSIIKDYYLLYRFGSILVAGTDAAGGPLMVYVNMSDASVQWSINEKFGRVIAVNELGEQELLVVTLFHNYSINASTGEIIWKEVNSVEAKNMEELGAFGDLMKGLVENVASEEEINVEFYREPDSEYFFLSGESEKTDFNDQPTGKFESSINAYRVSDGSLVWENVTEFDGRLEYLLFEENGLLTLTTKGSYPTINLYDYTTGKGQWGKNGAGISTKGGVHGYVETEQGILLETVNVNGRNFLNYLDPATGNMLFEKAVRIEGDIVGAIPTTSSVIYLTGQGLNIIDLTSGELKWKRSIPTRAALSGERDGNIYLYDLKDELLKVMNLETQEVTNFSETALSFDGKEEPQQLEIVEDGIVLYSDQNIAKYDFSGALLFNNYYPAPREAAWIQALRYATAAVAALDAVESYYNAAVLDNAAREIKGQHSLLGTTVDQMGDAFEERADASSDYVVAALTRIGARKKATTAGRDYNFIVTKEGKDILLLKVSKATGEVEGQISFGRDREPRYTVDLVTHQVYYHKGRATLKSYLVD